MKKRSVVEYFSSIFFVDYDSTVVLDYCLRSFLYILLYNLFFFIYSVNIIIIMIISGPLII